MAQQYARAAFMAGMRGLGAAAPTPAPAPFTTAVLLNKALGARLMSSSTSSTEDQVTGGVRAGVGPEDPDRHSLHGKGEATEEGTLTPEQVAISRENQRQGKEQIVKWLKEDLQMERPDRQFRDPDPYAGVNTAGTVTGTLGEYEGAASQRELLHGMQDTRDTRAKEKYASDIGYDSMAYGAPRRSGDSHTAGGDGRNHGPDGNGEPINRGGSSGGSSGGNSGGPTAGSSTSPGTVTREMTSMGSNPLASQGITGDDARAPTTSGASQPGPSQGSADLKPGSWVNPVTGEADAGRAGSDSDSTPKGNRTIPDTIGQKIKHFASEALETLTHGVNNAGQPQVKEKLEKD